MSYKRLYIFVEGNDDERFFLKILKPVFEKNFNYIQIVKYAQKTCKFINDFVKSIESMEDAEYLFVTDIDNKECVDSKKSCARQVYNTVDSNRIVVVIKEVESWYLAGLNNSNSKKFKINCPDCTDDITKEKFDMIVPQRFTSRIAFMIELLNVFCKETAKEKNKSFRYLMENFAI